MIAEALDPESGGTVQFKIGVGVGWGGTLRYSILKKNVGSSPKLLGMVF